MLWSKNQKIIYYYSIACQFFFLQHHNINIKTQSTPGAHAVFPVGGVWTCLEGRLEGHAMQSLLSENVYENKRVGSYGGVCTRTFCYIHECMT